MESSSASVLGRLKNKAKQDKIPFQQIFNLFCQEEFIRKLELSSYSNKLILKGEFLLYSISGFTIRPTVDADYLLKHHSNEISSVEKMVRTIMEENTGNEFVTMEIRNLKKISEMKEYHGIRVNLIGHIGKTNTPFSIDFGIEDVIVPAAVERELPVQLDDFAKPVILTYSLESTVSEKIDAIVDLMEGTGCMKDFYDIFYLAKSFKFEGRKLQEAIYETFSHRGRLYEMDSVIVIQRLTDNLGVVKRWKNFCKKILKYELNFREVVEVIVAFINPPFQAIINEEEFLGTWNNDKMRYENMN